MTQDTFSSLGLREPILRALRAAGYDHPTPIQREAIPPALQGRDILGCAQTGTGKTAAFALPILQHLGDDRRAHARRPRALILTPTRELAAQIGDSFAVYGRYTPPRHTVLYGGVGQKPQVRALLRGVEILVATPGRLLDLVGQGFVRLDRVEIAVLDEADRMLDMGFFRDVERILAVLPEDKQSLLFSATMPGPIARLAAERLRDPVRVAVTPVSSTTERIDQRVLFVSRADKRALLSELLEDPEIKRALVFTRTKHGANRLAKQLNAIQVASDAIHGNKSQGARTRVLEAFKRGRIRVLVATDLAARGIDVEGITHVINFDLPVEPESYVHRIGRTGRAGASGAALSFCDAEERVHLRGIERLIRQPLPAFTDHPYHQEPLPKVALEDTAPVARRPRSRSRRRRGSYGTARGLKG